jgi:hypothetical protein
MQWYSTFLNAIYHRGRCNDTNHNDTQHNAIQHNNRWPATLSIMAEHCYADCHLCWVSLILHGLVIPFTAVKNHKTLQVGSDTSKICKFAYVQTAKSQLLTLPNLAAPRHLSIMTFSIMTFSIMTFSIMTFSIIDLIVTPSLNSLKNIKHNDKHRYPKCHYA